MVSNIFYFPFHIWDVIFPIDELHHFSRWLKPPPTSYKTLDISGLLCKNRLNNCWFERFNHVQSRPPGLWWNWWKTFSRHRRTPPDLRFPKSWEYPQIINFFWGDFHGFSIINDLFGGSSILGSQKIGKSTRATFESPIFVGYTTPPSSMTETEVAKFMGKHRFSTIELSDESIGRSSMELYPSKCWSGYVFQIWIYAKILVKDCKGAYSPLNFWVLANIAVDFNWTICSDRKWFQDAWCWANHQFSGPAHQVFRANVKIRHRFQSVNTIKRNI